MKPEPEHPEPRAERPGSYEEAAALLQTAAAQAHAVRFCGGATKFGWGRSVPEPDLVLETGGLNRVLEHNAGDFTAVLQAGVPLAVAQAACAESGQMLALDPPLASDAGTAGATPATIGGIVSTNDSGPLRHRYGGVRDLVVGVTVVLSDGTVARSGGKVIKNVAGYDLGKLYAGAFGTLGLIVEVTVRLHPRPARTSTAVGRSSDPAALAAGAATLAHAPLEAECLDLRWESGAGAVLARFASADPGPRVEQAAALLALAGLEVEVQDGSGSSPSAEVGAGGAGPGGEEGLWAAQRTAQRGDVVIKVSALPTVLPAVLDAAEALGATMVARAGLGLAWVRLGAAAGGDTSGLVAMIEELRRHLAPAPCVVLDAPGEVRAALDPWGNETGPVDLMRRVKERFDPAGICAPGLFVGGI